MWLRSSEEIRGGGFINLLLSWFVLLNDQEDNAYVFRLAILLMKGEKVVLASLYLESLYA